MQAIGHVKLLSAEEETELSEKIKKGDAAARDRMILANLRLVVKIAYDYSGMGVPLVDLISEGNLGLIKAIDRFSPRRGGRLATYAAWWIRQTIKSALASQSKMMRLPMHMVEKIARLRRTTNELTAKLGREPTPAEISKATRFSLRRLEQLKNLSTSTVSLEVSSPEEQSLEETIGDESEEGPLKRLLRKSNRERVDEILSQLDPRMAELLKLRHGIDGQPPKTLDEIGQLLGLTRERVRQLEQEAQAILKRKLFSDDIPAPKSNRQDAGEKRRLEKIEVLRQFMLEKGLFK
jgi:RNA polymerase primary sigma factor